MPKVKLKEFSNDESKELLNEVVSEMKVLEKKLRRLQPSIEEEQYCEIRFGGTESTTISVDLHSNAARVVRQGIVVARVGRMKTKFNRSIVEKDERELTSEELETIAALEKKFGKDYVVKEDNSIPWQQPWL